VPALNVTLKHLDSNMTKKDPHSRLLVEIARDLGFSVRSTEILRDNNFLTEQDLMLLDQDVITELHLPIRDRIALVGFLRHKGSPGIAQAQIDSEIRRQESTRISSPVLIKAGKSNLKPTTVLICHENCKISSSLIKILSNLNEPD
jgi:hypothetical protein